MKKLSNKILIITFLLLAAVFVLSRRFHAPGKESNLRVDLIKLDTARITEVHILPSSHHEEEIKLFRDGPRWKVSKGKEEAATDGGLVNTMLGMLYSVQPQRRVSHKKEKWEDFNVGEKGTHISVYENSTKRADFMVGKTGFTQTPGGGFGGGFTYFRLTDEDEVYVVEGFFESGFNRAYNDWRNKALIRVTKEDIAKIEFRYPLDTGFVAEKKDSLWYVLPLGVDASSMQNYLNRISTQNMDVFVDEFVPPGPADVTVKIEGKQRVLERVEGWKRDKNWVLTSSLQKGVYFTSSEVTVRNLLIGKKKLLSGDRK